MSDESRFQSLLAQVRQGDQAAAAELVRLYEPELRRAIRVRMTNQELRRTLDSMDIVQSVLGKFFAQLATGNYDLHDSQELVGLLLTMANNKLMDKERRNLALRRTEFRNRHDEILLLSAIPGNAESPSEFAVRHELTEFVEEKLTQNERYIAEQRARGRDWNSLAEELRTTAEALRKRHARTMDRLRDRLDLGSWDHT